MTDQPLHSQHLQSAQQQQQQLLSEIQELQNQVSAKRELVLKVQGVIEYLQQIEASQPTTPEVPTETTEPNVES